MSSGDGHSVAALDSSAPVELALEQSQEVEAKVQECAEDIGATNAAVQTKIGQGEATLSAPEALAEGKKVEGKVEEVADDLHKVTETLAKGIEELEQLEADLCESRAALAASDAALAKSAEAERESLHRALHDSTTGLPNRDLFDTRLDQAISVAKRHGWTLAVMFFDLDRFKRINDTHGHAAGDAVLQEVANRLSGNAREEDTVCRNGGDEFLYLLVDPQGRHNIERIAKSVLQRVGQPIAWEDALLKVETSIGIAVYPADGDTGEELVRSADAAMYVAKKRRSGYAFAEPVDASEAA